MPSASSDVPLPTTTTVVTEAVVVTTTAPAQSSTEMVLASLSVGILIPAGADAPTPALTLAETGAPATEPTTTSATLTTTFATASPSTELDPEGEFVKLLTKNFYESLEGSLSLLFKSKKTSFSVLKASLLYCIESIRTVGGSDSVVALEKVLAGFGRDVDAWQALRHAELFPKADAEFQRLSERLLKLREDEMLHVKTLEQDLESARATGELVAHELDTIQQAIDITDKQLVAARQMIEKANAIIARAEPVQLVNLQKRTELADRSIQLVRDETAKAHELEEAKARLANTLALAEEDLRKQALATVEEERRRELSALELKLKSYVNR
jgi:hypothetical protein